MNKIIISLIIGIFLLTSVGAFEFDNTISYSEENSVATITNAFGLGSDIAKIRLLTPLHNYVMPGKDRRVIEYNIETYEDYEDVIEGLKILNMKNNKEENKQYKIKYAVYNKRDVYKNEDINCVDKELGNQSIEINCEKKKVWTGEESYIEEWKDLINLDFIKGNLTIALITDVDYDDYYDGIFTMFGNSLDKHATWASSFNVGLLTYWNMNDSVEMVSGKYNLTINQGVGVEYTGINALIPNSANFTDNNNNNVTDRDAIFSFKNIGESKTLNFWGRWNGVTSPQRFFVKSTAEFYEQNSNMYFDGVGIISMELPINASGWSMFTLVKDTENITAYMNGNMIVNTTIASSANVTDSLFIGGQSSGAYDLVGMMDEISFWNRTLTATEITNLYNGGEGLTYLKGGTPLTLSVALNSPGNNSIVNSLNYSFNATSSVVGGEVQNVTYYLYNDNSSIKNKTTIITSANETNLNIHNLVFGESYLWNVFSCINNSDGNSTCAFAPANYSLNIGFIVGEKVFNINSYESKSESYIQNFTIPLGLNVTSAKFIWNNTNYSASVTNRGTATNFSLNSSIYIPLVSSNNISFYWSIILNNGQESAISTQYQNITKIDLSACYSGARYMNITFKNETISAESVKATIDSTWIYYLDSALLNRTLLLSNTTENYDYGICFNVPFLPINTKMSMTYGNSYSETRSYSMPTITTLTNITTNLTLYLLPSSLGIYTTFQVLNSVNQPISNVNINFSTALGTSGSSITDAAGTSTIFLNPTTSYTFIFYKTGYTTFTTTITPTQSAYTITLGGGGGQINTTDFSKGITYNIQPYDVTLNNDTNYHFNLTLSSSVYDLTSWGFTIKNNTGDVLDTQSSALGTGGVLDTIILTNSSYSYITLNAYWIIEGQQFNASRTWYIMDSGDSSYSIKYFFTDLTTFIGSGLFGLESGFSLRLIIFLVIFLIVGVLSYNFGLRSEATLVGLITLLVAFFDIGLNMLPPVSFGSNIQINHFPTIIMVLISSALIWKEVSN